jgi:predicted unusual protein kinase regulating ubiquinone biosynthesis (AarF/ABC1/UbiB family)
MADAGVSGVVVADVLDDFSNDVVLTTQWIDGEQQQQQQQQQQFTVASTLLRAAPASYHVCSS